MKLNDIDWKQEPAFQNSILYKMLINIADEHLGNSAINISTYDPQIHDHNADAAEVETFLDGMTDTRWSDSTVDIKARVIDGIMYVNYSTSQAKPGHSYSFWVKLEPVS